MRARAPQRTRRGRVTAAGAAAVAALLWAATPALGHAVLLETDPGDGAVVEGAPEQVVLLFDERMEQPSTVTVTGPEGATVADGEADIDGERVRTALTDVTVDGTYSVRWRAVSADGHPLEGVFAFEVVGAEGAEVVDEPAGAGPTAAPEPSATAGADDRPADAGAGEDAAAAPAADDGGGTVRWLLAGAAVLAVLVSLAAGAATRRQAKEG